MFYSYSILKGDSEMEEKQFQELKELVAKDGFSGDWAWIILMLLFGFNNNGTARINEEIKMKEDIAELKGKMSMIEKML